MSTKKRAKNGEPEAFIEMAKKYDEEDCLIWPYAINGAGYANFRNVNAHSLVCPGERTFEKWQAAHTCGNRLCMNPNHLEWSSQSDNELDKLTHGRRRGRPKTGPSIVPLSEYKGETDEI